MLSKKENFTHTKNKGEKGIVENGKEWLQHQNKKFSEGVKSMKGEKECVKYYFFFYK